MSRRTGTETSANAYLARVRICALASLDATFRDLAGTHGHKPLQAAPEEDPHSVESRPNALFSSLREGGGEPRNRVVEIQRLSVKKIAQDDMHTGEQYHTFILASQRDRAVRDRFQKMALELLPEGADVLDFGAGTGIDAKTYAARGHHTFVYEPAEAMRTYLTQHCHDEIHRQTVVPVASPSACKAQAVTANFAVLNYFADHASLFEELSHVVDRGGFVLASMLNPYYLGDARYGWWRANLMNLVRSGHYAVPSESGIHRFSPRAVAQAAAPYFRLERRTPRGLGTALQLYMFLLFRRA